MCKSEWHHTWDGKVRLAVAAEVTHRHAGTHCNGFLRGVQRLEVVGNLRIRIFYFTSLNLCHDAVEHDEGLTAETVVERTELVVVPGDDTQVCSLADIAELQRVTLQYGHGIIIVRERVLGTDNVRLDVECLHQGLQYVHTLNTV